ncbi:MAG TPA: GYD domain-containing protein [Burkholderiales bacterium]|jgi:uncharacterized protein with GYD domain|nr:GYD domain-containing protein [Burkholderiales bacterium]
MATYVTVGNFTDQGIRGVRDTTKRAAAVKEVAKKAGVTIKEIWWTMGQFDVIVIYEAPDDTSMSALALALGAAGNVRGQTLRAYSREEMDAVLKKMP